MAIAAENEETMTQSSDDPFDLRRFVEAQGPTIERVFAELRAGRKRSHWMWYVFPQIDGLGRSAMAQTYAIRSVAEARAFLAHPLLGDRLRDCVRLVVAAGRPLGAVFGAPDDVKFRSSMTLFAAAAPEEAVFAEALRRLCDDAADPATLARLASPPPAIRTTRDAR
jgi:uncharacterized protein (DUF1810 family)